MLRISSSVRIKPDAADQVLLRMQRQDIAAGIGVVAGKGPVDRRKRQIIVAQPVRVDQHLVFLDMAADGVDFRHAPDRAQHRPHHPVLNRAPFNQFLERKRALAVVRMLDSVLVYLPKTGGYGPEHRRDARQQPGAIPRSAVP